MKLWYEGKGKTIAEWELGNFTYQLRNDGKIRCRFREDKWTRFRHIEVNHILNTINDSDSIYIEMHGFCRKQPSDVKNRSMLKRVYYECMENYD